MSALRERSRAKSRFGSPLSSSDRRRSSAGSPGSGSACPTGAFSRNVRRPQALPGLDRSDPGPRWCVPPHLVGGILREGVGPTERVASRDRRGPFSHHMQPQAPRHPRKAVGRGVAHPRGPGSLPSRPSSTCEPVTLRACRHISGRPQGPRQNEPSALQRVRARQRPPSRAAFSGAGEPARRQT